MKNNIYHTLKERILYLEYAPGLILREKDMAEEFGISKSPLRTVLQQLQWENLLTILPRAGILVRELDLGTLTEVYQARVELEGVIGAMAASRFNETHFQRLDKLTGECDGLLNHCAPRQLVELDTRIKQLFYDAAQNAYLVKTSDQLYTLTLRLWYFNLLKMDSETWNDEIRAMKAELIVLCSLLKQKDPEKVRQARKGHLLEHMERIRSQFLR